MRKEILKTDKAPKAIGPYSQGIKTGNLVFLSGQVPINPVTGEISGNIKEQTRQVLENLKGVLASAGATLQDVVKTTVFMKDLNEFTAMNEVYQEYFSNEAPARSTVEVSKIPRGALVEIEAIAVIQGGR